MNKYVSAIVHLPQQAWTWYKGMFRGRAWYIKIVSSVCTLIVLFAVYLIMVDINFLWLFGKSPSISDVKNTHPAEASEIYSADGKMIGKFFSENRTPVTYDEVSPYFWAALIDTEDERFRSHHGIDYQAFAAALKDYVLHRDARGASTITQQLAKNLFRVRTQYSTGLLGNIPGLKILIMKSKEWITAYKLEWNFSKNEILTMYANTVDFGSNAFGIKTASKTYFGTTPKNLTADQAAILVGLLKATTYYNPRINPKNSLSRRNVVLANMLSHGDLTREAFDTLKAKPISLDYYVENAYDGEANYFREAVADYLKDWCEDNGYNRNALYTEGFKIYTTLDTRMQRYAEEAAVKQMRQVQRTFNNHWGRTNPWQDEHHVEIPHFIEDLAKKTSYYKLLKQKYDGNQDSIDYYLNLPHRVKLFDYDNGYIEQEMSTLDSIRYMEHFMHCGFVAIEPQTGHVKAWVGDIDFKTWKYDKVTAMRQPGSTFKLFVYSEAMNQGIMPCDTRLDAYFSMKVFDKQKNKEVTWAPTNADGIFSGGNITLKQAFAMSINSVAVRLGQECGIERIAKTAHDMGIKSHLDPTPALALGSSDVNLLELVNAYCTPVNSGKAHEPVLVTRILDRDGNEIYTAPNTDHEALTPRSAFLVNQLLMGGMSGTSSRLRSYVGYSTDTDFGGKTGTSNNHSDAWFIATSPRLVCGAWVGGEYRCIHFRTGELGQGNRTALPICGYFMQSVLADNAFRHYHAKFEVPKDLDIAPSKYGCGGYYKAHSDSDSTSVAADGEEQEAIPAINDPDNPALNIDNQHTGGEAKPATTEPQPAQATKEE
ncbi:MAG: penicillin-binding protein [Prevotella sp.]|nr:penicillin-binding protein [Prevotella sp.]